MPSIGVQQDLSDIALVKRGKFSFCISALSRLTIINPRRACAARVTVVVLCVCVSVILIVPQTIRLT